jgi:hypothetical protein
MMHRCKSFDGLDLYQQLFRNDKIHSLVAQQLVSIHHWHHLLDFEREPIGLQFKPDSPPIDALQQAGAKFAVNGDAATDDRVNERLEFIVER